MKLVTYNDGRVGQRNPVISWAEGHPEAASSQAAAPAR
jgi:hypothetical protein